MKEGECCLAHALVPVVLKLSEVARLRSAAAPRDPPLRPAPPKLSAPFVNEKVLESVTSRSEPSEVKEQRRRQQHKKRVLMEAAAAELRSRETIKQLESAMVAAQV